jgi:hypothetical protein
MILVLMEWLVVSVMPVYFGSRAFLKQELRTL